MRKTKYLVLIDDYEPANKFNEIIVKASKLFDEYKIFSSALDALDFFRKDGRVPDLILLDINMPKMDGWEFLEEFQKMTSFKKTTVMMLTTSMSITDVNRSVEFNMVKDFLPKPLTINHLKESAQLLEEESRKVLVNY